MTKDLIETLSAPFDPAKISWRVGSTNKEKTRGMALAYIDARDVMARLDEACGPGGWQCRYPHAGQKTICEIGVKVGDEWVWRADGAGDTDFEAEKGAISDAFKRAAVKWGVGRYLYDVDAPWVAIVAVGRSYAIADSELPKLQKLLPGSKVQTAPREQISNANERGERQLSKAQARPEYDKLVKEMEACQSTVELEQWGARNKPRLSAMPDDWQQSLRNEYADHKANLIGRAAQ